MKQTLRNSPPLMHNYSRNIIPLWHSHVILALTAGVVADMSPPLSEMGFWLPGFANLSQHTQLTSTEVRN